MAQGEEFLNTTEEEPIWSKGRLSSTDVEACLFMLELRKHYDDDFKNTNVKNSVWQKIANDMIKTGFFLGNGNPIEKCRRKFQNMKRTYLGYVTHRTTKTKPLFYFDCMEEILSLETVDNNSSEVSANSPSHSNSQESDIFNPLIEIKTENDTFEESQDDRLEEIPEHKFNGEEISNDKSEEIPDDKSEDRSVDFANDEAHSEDEHQINFTASAWNNNNNNTANSNNNKNDLDMNILQTIDIIHTGTVEVLKLNFNKIHSGIERLNMLLTEQNRQTNRLLNFLIEEKMSAMENIPASRKRKYSNDEDC